MRMIDNAMASATRDDPAGPIYVTRESGDDLPQSSIRDTDGRLSITSIAANAIWPVLIIMAYVYCAHVM